MDEKQLYQQLLGIASPWHVDRVELDTEKEEVLVHVVCKAVGGILPCPECKRLCPCYDLREERKWRHLDSCGFSTFLVSRTPRVACEEHGVKTASVPWSSPHSRFTTAFECFAITVLRSTMVQRKAAALLRLSDAQIHDLMARAVERGMARRKASESKPIKHVSLDEKSFKKGHSFITVLGDTQQCRVLDVVEGYSTEDANRLLKQALTPLQLKQVESVTMDMWDAFQRAQRETLPEADIVHDRFHIAKYLGNAVDLTRRQEHRRLAAGNSKSSPLHKTKYHWLTNPKNLTPEKQAVLDAVRAHDLETGKVWMFKEAFRQFYTANDVTEAMSFFINWRDAAIELGNKFLTQVVKLMDNHLRGLLNYHFHRTSNATAEGLNSQIQRIKANARGFRRFANYRIAILFFLGKLELYPQTNP
jgi:transposase